MKVIIIATGKTENVSNEYGERLIEQGQAMLAPAPEKPQEPEEKPAKPQKKK